jgi:hypothetical protein
MDDTKLRQTVKNDPSGDFYTSFTDIRQLNENDAEIKRLKQENEFLNKILETLFPEKIQEEEPQYVNYVPQPVIPSTPPPSTIKYPEFVKEPIILDLYKRNLSKFVEFLELPEPELMLQTQARVQEKKMEEKLNLFSQVTSLSDIKDKMLNDPTYFTRMQGLKNLEKSSQT